MDRETKEALKLMAQQITTLGAMTALQMEVIVRRIRREEVDAVSALNELEVVTNLFHRDQLSLLALIAQAGS